MVTGTRQAATHVEHEVWGEHLVQRGAIALEDRLSHPVDCRDMRVLAHPILLVWSC
jgi:hypothetical protein